MVWRTSHFYFLPMSTKVPQKKALKLGQALKCTKSDTPLCLRLSVGLESNQMHWNSRGSAYLSKTRSHLLKDLDKEVTDWHGFGILDQVKIY